MLQDYHHCRTLLISSMVESCRIEVAFSSGAIEPQAAEPGTYELTVESGARVIIQQDERGFGQARGSASVDLLFDLPAEAAPPAFCLQRSQYLYFATGPEGGWSDAERSALRAAGARPLVLGGRILRAETAVVAGLTLLQYLLGDLLAPVPERAPLREQGDEEPEYTQVEG